MKPSLDVGEKVSTRSSIYQRSCENEGRVTTIGLVFFIKQLKQIVEQGNLIYQMTTYRALSHLAFFAAFEVQSQTHRFETMADQDIIRNIDNRKTHTIQ